METSVYSVLKKKRKEAGLSVKEVVLLLQKKVYLYLIKRYIVGKADIVSPTQKPSLYSAISTKSLI